MRREHVREPVRMRPTNHPNKRNKTRAEQVVEFVLSGATQADVLARFSYATRHSANAAIYTSFKKLGLRRPRQSVRIKCKFCGQEFKSQNPSYKFCSEKCNRASWKVWSKNNPVRLKSAQRKYVHSEKGKARNKKRHALDRKLGRDGTSVERWYFAVTESSKAIRRRKSLAKMTDWDKRILLFYRSSKNENFGGMGKRIATFKQKSRRGSSLVATNWNIACETIQSALWRRSYRLYRNEWEQSIVRLRNAIDIGERKRA